VTLTPEERVQINDAYREQLQLHGKLIADLFMTTSQILYTKNSINISEFYNTFEPLFINKNTDNTACALYIIGKESKAILEMEGLYYIFEKKDLDNSLIRTRPYEIKNLSSEFDSTIDSVIIVSACNLAEGIHNTKIVLGKEDCQNICSKIRKIDNDEEKEYELEITKNHFFLHT